MIRTNYLIPGASFWLLALVIIACVMRVGPTRVYVIGSPGDEQIAAGFMAAESNEEGAYRWTDGDSILRFFGQETARGRTVHARLTSVQDRAFPTAVAFQAGDFVLGRVQAPPSWRVYELLLPPRSGWRPAELRIVSPVFQPSAEDDRTLGVAVKAAWSAAVAGRNWPASLEYAAFAATIVVALTFGLGGATDRRRVGFVGGLLLLALWTVGLWTWPEQLALWLPPLWRLVLIVGLGTAMVGLSRWLARQRPAWWLSVPTGVMLGLVGQLLLRRQVGIVAGGLLLLVGAAVVAACSRPWQDHPARDSSSGRWAISTPAWLGLCCLLALVLRLYRLDAIPFGLWRDEARHGLLALEILRDPTFRPVYVPYRADLPALLFYLQTVPIALLGPTIGAARLVPAVAGSLTVFPVYVLGRQLAGAKVGLIAALLLAVSSWHIALSRLASPAVLDPLLSLTGAVILLALLDGKRPWAGRWRFVGGVAAGVCIGLALYTYHTGRLAPVVAAAVVLARLGRGWSGWRRAGPALVGCSVAALLVALPLISYMRSAPDEFNRRFEQIGVVRGNPEYLSTTARFESNIVRYVLMWNLQGDANARHHVPDVPLFDLFTGFFFVVGLIMLPRRPGSRQAKLLLGLLLLTLVPGVLSSGAPHGLRSVDAIAPALLVAAYGIAGVAGGLRRVEAGWLRLVAGAGLLTAITLFNMWVYFGHMPYDPRVWDQFGYPGESVIGDYARRAGSQSLLVPRQVADTDVFRYLAYDLPVGTFTADEPPAALPSQAMVLLPANPSPAERRWVEQATGDRAPRPLAMFPGTSQPAAWAYQRTGSGSSGDVSGLAGAGAEPPTPAQGAPRLRRR